MLNKNMIFFGVSLMLFILILGYPTYIYLKWDRPLDEEEASLEVNLPVISWEKYLSLSKQYE